jgi:hypothetical protein
VIPALAEIQRILLREWDPIGVRDAPGAVDEYDRYAFDLYVALQSKPRPNTDDIAAYLDQLQTEHIGLDLTSEHNRRIAGMIAGLRTT